MIDSRSTKAYITSSVSISFTLPSSFSSLNTAFKSNFLESFCVISILASAGSKFDKLAKSLPALALALDSSALPNKINANNKTGSSKKSFVRMPYSFSTGCKAFAPLNVNAAKAPTPTNEFIVGLPFLNATNPSDNICLPGPSKAALAIAAPIHGFAKLVTASPCAYSCNPNWWRWCETCVPKHAIVKPHAKYKSFVVRSFSSSRFC